MCCYGNVLENHHSHIRCSEPCHHGFVLFLCSGNTQIWLMLSRCRTTQQFYIILKSDFRKCNNVDNNLIMISMFSEQWFVNSFSYRIIRPCPRLRLRQPWNKCAPCCRLPSGTSVLLWSRRTVLWSSSCWSKSWGLDRFVNLLDSVKMPLKVCLPLNLTHLKEYTGDTLGRRILLV